MGDSFDCDVGRGTSVGVAPGDSFILDELVPALAGASQFPKTQTQTQMTQR